MITPPPLVDANPGDPITSEGWNSVLNAIRIVYDALNKDLGSLSLIVKNKADGNPLPGARVTATPKNETQPVRSGLYAGADVKRFLVPRLLAGAYTVTVEADGFATESRSITMDDAGGAQDLTIEMTATEVLFPAPNLFGRFLTEATKVVADQGLQLTRIVDSHGRDVPPGSIPDEVKNAVVMAQAPEPGTPVAANSAVQLSVTARAEFIERVKVPDIRGLTLEEAKAKLAAAGLALGGTGSVGK
jgi:hypothetical protein